MDQQWIALEVTLPPEFVDPVANFCHERSSAGLVFEETDRGDTRLTAYYQAEVVEEAARELRLYLGELADIFPHRALPDVRWVPVKPENWAIMWKDGFKAIHLGRNLIVTPPWITPESGERTVIVIEPAQAFGTGTHETTHGCLVLLEEAVELLNPLSSDVGLIDVGCGSGILAIAGSKLGVKKVLGIDNDPVAVAAARKNAFLNGVADRIGFECLPLAELSLTADIVTANLDPLALKQHADRLTSLFTRFLIISGVPVDQWDAVKELLNFKGVRTTKEILGAEWAGGLFVRREQQASRRGSISFELKFGTEHLHWPEVCRIFALAPLGKRDPEKLRRAAENSYLVCSACEGTAVIGFARAISDGEFQSAIYDVVVAPEHQGKGVGRALVEALLAGLPPGPVITYVVPGKEGFYAKLGFDALLTGMVRCPSPRMARENGYIS